jgi:general secretion pathway protein L
MSSLSDITGYLTRWIDSVAALVVNTLSSLGTRKRVQVIEEEDGSFVFQSGASPTPSGLPFERALIADGKITADHPGNVAALLRGSRAELVLRPSRFLFRPLELPKRATEFLGGVVRAQIDRLTPWTAIDAAFGYGLPAEAGPDRMVVTVAATARTMVQPLVDALSAAGADAVVVTTAPPGGAPIQVIDHHARGVLDAARVRFVLAAVLIVAGLGAGISLSAAGFVGANLASRQDELTRRIAERRLALRAGRESATQASTPLRALERRKQQSGAAVIVLEVLSQILPDHTYVTELRIEGDKLRVIGVTRDAPALIRLMEQSPHFTRATFFAPTTRAPSDPGERFHIEAQIEPVFALRS